MMTTKRQFLHRDDVDYRTVERIEAEIRKQVSGGKAVFAGDLPEESQEAVFAEIERLCRCRVESSETGTALTACNAKVRESLESGSCIFCGSLHPRSWEPESSTFEMPDGWGWVVSQEIIGFYGVCCKTCGGS